MNSFIAKSIEDILEKNSLIDSLLPELQDYDILGIIYEFFIFPETILNCINF